MKKRTAMLPIVITCCLVVFIISYKKESYLDHPFEISVSTPEILCESEQIYGGNDTLRTLDGIQKRLVITASIDNASDLKYKNVWFELELNKDMKPYIASQIIKYASSDKLDVTTLGQAQTINVDVAKKPIVSGFEHEWGLLLLSEDDLKEYYGLSAEGIYSALKNITVRIYWDGGSQIITRPLALNSEQRDTNGIRRKLL